MLFVWPMVGLPAALLVLRDERLVAEATRQNGRGAVLAIGRDLVRGVVGLVLALLWPIALLQRRRITDWLAERSWMRGVMTLPRRAFQPLSPWRVAAYRVVAGAVVVLALAALVNRGALWFAVPGLYLLVTLFAAKSSNQRQQILGR